MRNLLLILFMILFVRSAYGVHLLDSAGKLIPGIYNLRLGNGYSYSVDVEILPNSTYRMYLEKRNLLNMPDIHHLVEGKIVRKSQQVHSDIFEFQLTTDSISRVEENVTGLLGWYFRISDTKLIPEDTTAINDIRISLTANTRGTKALLSMVPLSEISKNFFTFFTMNTELRKPRKADISYERFSIPKCGESMDTLVSGTSI